MASELVERRLAAIMLTDIVGYTALMAESEEKGSMTSSPARMFFSKWSPTFRLVMACDAWNLVWMSGGRFDAFQEAP
jgi:hypothetical protein